MATEIKWAEVAHYYKELPILVDGSCERTAVFFWPSGKCHSVVRFYSESGKETGASHENLSVVEYAPILRALEDMTLQEKMEIFALAGPSEKPHDWEFRIKIIKEYSASELHWFISKGFDVFGLIESGQAIRKGAGV